MPKMSYKGNSKPKKMSKGGGIASAPKHMTYPMKKQTFPGHSGKSY